jgi:hypothetical protein
LYPIYIYYTISISIPFIQTSPLKYKGQDGALKARFIALLDGSSRKPIKICLFGADAETPPEPEDIVRISHTYPYRMRHGNKSDANPTSLGTKPATSVEASSNLI